MKTILITGGTGLVGLRLSEILQEQGYRVLHLSRHQNLNAKFAAYAWDIARKQIDTEALLQADAIVHLAGASIADAPWTPEKRRNIIESRTHSAALLAETLATLPNHHVKTFVSASAIGIYGIDTADKWLTEDQTPDNGAGFPAEVTRLWEKSVQTIAQQGIRLVKMRIGIVLSPKGGALPQMAAPVRFGFGAALASGQQYTSWIHIDDLCRMFVWAIENPQAEGAYNAVAPNPVTNAELTKEIAKTLHRPLWLPNVPLFALRLIASDMADVVAGSNRVSCQQIEKEGFKFEFPQLPEALQDLLR